jgi:hypothetical protein
LQQASRLNQEQVEPASGSIGFAPTRAKQIDNIKLPPLPIMAKAVALHRLDHPANQTALWQSKSHSHYQNHRLEFFNLSSHLCYQHA